MVPIFVHFDPYGTKVKYGRFFNSLFRKRADDPWGTTAETRLATSQIMHLVQQALWYYSGDIVSHFLPWFGDYHDDKNERTPIDRNELDRIASNLLAEINRKDENGQLSRYPLDCNAYEILLRRKHSSKDLIQGMAVEVMLRADEALQHIFNGMPLRALVPASYAHQKLSDLAFEAHERCGLSGAVSANARRAADVRHKENRAMKEEALAHYDAIKNAHRSKDAAAAAIAGVIVPITFRQVREWITEHDKKLRSARTP